MLSTSDLKVISHLRNDARKKVTDISREVQMPVTTIYDKIRAQHRKGILKKHVALVDFRKIGYSTSALISFKTGKSKIHDLEAYLIRHPNVNTVYSTDYGSSYLIEVIFEDDKRLNEFVYAAEEKFSLEEPIIFHITRELKKEEFMSLKG